MTQEEKIGDEWRAWSNECGWRREEQTVCVGNYDQQLVLHIFVLLYHGSERFFHLTAYLTPLRNREIEGDRKEFPRPQGEMK
jgi:hypothetical protein